MHVTQHEIDGVQLRKQAVGRKYTYKVYDLFRPIEKLKSLDNTWLVGFLSQQKHEGMSILTFFILGHYHLFNVT